MKVVFYPTADDVRSHYLLRIRDAVDDGDADLRDVLQDELDLLNSPSIKPDEVLRVEIED